MQKWEYITLKFEAEMKFLATGKIDQRVFQDALNKAGAEGWEVCGVVDTNIHGGTTRDLFVLMKRPVMA